MLRQVEILTAVASCLFLILTYAGAGLADEGAHGRGGDDSFEGRFFAGEGDVEYLELLDICARLLYPDPEYQNISMLYSPRWNGFVEGPTWGAWWIQNSYGPTYCGLPFFVEPYTTFVQNAQDLWFTQMGDGRRKGARDWVAPDGCLCDAASPGWIYYKQGDGRVDIHDWGVEFTAAGIVLQSEALLVERDPEAIARHLPMLRRSAEFIESRRNPDNNLFLAGPAGNLLAPSYAGWRRDDGSYDKAYLTGLSVTYIASLDRLIELERMGGDSRRVAIYARRRDLARQGLRALATGEGYFVKSLDPDGVRHGVYGADKHGYFEAVCNHDAIALRVVDDSQARKIMDKMTSIPGLRPHDVVITNYPGLDDMYVEPTSWLWSFGTWVNGGHWSTCEARMILAYFRTGRFADARRSMEHILGLMRRFRADNPLVEFGAKVYQPNEPINCVYDTWGAPTGMLRGLFEYVYSADGLTLLPHIPKGITRLTQRLPVRLGRKRLYLETRGRGHVAAVWVNGRPWRRFDAGSVHLPDRDMPAQAHIVICMGGAVGPGAEQPAGPSRHSARMPDPGDAFWDVSAFVQAIRGNARPLRIGADSKGASRFLGMMRRARVFDRELSPDQVNRLAASPDADLGEGCRPFLDYRLQAPQEGIIPNQMGEDFAAKVIGQLKVEQSELGPALRFDGDGYLEVAFDPRLNLAGPYSLDAWVCPDKLPEGGARIIDKVTAGVDDGYLLDTHPGNSLRLITEHGSVSYAAGLTPGVWAHVAGTFSPEGELRLYINGELTASTAAKRRALSSPVPWSAIGTFHELLCRSGLGDSYEARHARLVVDYVAAMHERAGLLQAGKLPPLPDASQAAADRSYIDATDRLTAGLAATVQAYAESDDPRERKVLALWRQALARTADARNAPSARLP